jgi:hypothetical protein
MLKGGYGETQVEVTSSMFSGRIFVSKSHARLSITDPKSESPSHLSYSASFSLSVNSINRSFIFSSRVALESKSLHLSLCRTHWRYKSILGGDACNIK